MELLNKNITSGSRRFFLTALSASVGGLVLLLQIGSKKTVRGTTKFLTQDGMLVEIPTDIVPLARVAITKDRLLSWIWKHQKL
jgi:hypothetical protein